MDQTKDPQELLESLGVSQENAFSCACAFMEAFDAWDEVDIPEVSVIDFALCRGVLNDPFVLAPYLWEGSKTGNLALLVVALQWLTPQLTDDQGNTPLHYATCYPACMLSLLEHGADPNHRNEQGVRPIDVCQEEGSAKSMVLLLAKGAQL